MPGVNTDVKNRSCVKAYTYTYDLNDALVFGKA